MHGLSSEAQESFAVSGSVANSENGDWGGSRARRGGAWEARVQQGLCATLRATGSPPCREREGSRSILHLGRFILAEGWRSYRRNSYALQEMGPLACTGGCVWAAGLWRWMERSRRERGMSEGSKGPGGHRTSGC